MDLTISSILWLYYNRHHFFQSYTCSSRFVASILHVLIRGDDITSNFILLFIFLSFCRFGLSFFMARSGNLRKVAPSWNRVRNSYRLKTPLLPSSRKRRQVYVILRGRLTLFAPSLRFQRKIRALKCIGALYSRR